MRTITTTFSVLELGHEWFSITHTLSSLCLSCWSLYFFRMTSFILYYDRYLIRLKAKEKTSKLQIKFPSFKNPITKYKSHSLASKYDRVFIVITQVGSLICICSSQSRLRRGLLHEVLANGVSLYQPHHLQHDDRSSQPLRSTPLFPSITQKPQNQLVCSSPRPCQSFSPRFAGVQFSALTLTSTISNLALSCPGRR